MVVDKLPFSPNALEQFVVLAKSAKDTAACTDLIKQVLEAPGVYVFSELLHVQNILELNNGPSKNYYSTLNLFAYGTYQEYLAQRKDLIELTPAQQKKLQHLTMATLATKTKCIPYGDLLKELDIANVRDLEDLIIEAIYADVIHGKLDQKNSQLEIDYALGRDIHPQDINVIVNCLQDWSTACEGVLGCVETQIHRANTEKSRSIVRTAEVEQEILNIKKTLKTQLQERSDGADEAMASDNREATATNEKSKKSAKIKGMRIHR